MSFNIAALGPNRSLEPKTGISPELNISLDLTWFFDAPNQPVTITKAMIEALAPAAGKALAELKVGQGRNRDGETVMLGWQDLPPKLDRAYLAGITEAAERLASRIDAYVSLGIGGSYLGIEATIRALGHNFANQLSREERSRPEIYFLGQNLDPDFLRDTLDLLRDKRVGVNVISKSGTTTETALAFRVMRSLLEDSFGSSARELIFVTTDEHKGALKRLALDKGYRTFTVPDDVGGRFSVLTEVGLVGLALAGVDLESFVAGFEAMRQRTMTPEFWENPALVHAACRVAAHNAGKQVEVVTANSSGLYHLARWMEQLFPESEGHEGKGLWVSPAMFSEKLHANGQMIQEGRRNLIETFLCLESPDNSLAIPDDPDDVDGLNYLSQKGTTMEELNRLIIDGPAYAHFLAGTPSLRINIPRRHPYCIGQVYYLMERSVALSGYMMGLNPFVQPGVEAYKKAVFALAGRPGFEKAGEEIHSAFEEREKIII